MFNDSVQKNRQTKRVATFQEFDAGVGNKLWYKI